jgi:hypothetical protein
MDRTTRRSLEEVLAESEQTLARLYHLIDRLNGFTAELTEAQATERQDIDQ